MTGSEGSPRKGGVRSAGRPTATPDGQPRELTRRGAMMGWESAR
jgi:hypothetical protein